jgi:hypothetical protein
MATITDEFMREMLTQTKKYCVVILKSGPKWGSRDAQKIIWEHGRRNFELRSEGKLSIVCPIADASEVRGVGIFNTDPAAAQLIMESDPGVMAGIFVYELHSCQSFPGDALPR